MMRDLRAIIRVNAEAAADAAKRGKVPFVCSIREVDAMQTFPFPYLEDYVPRGWMRADKEWFVDSSGFGTEDEPALTAQQFRESLREYIAAHPGSGFAIVEAGQFQVYVAAFERDVA